MRQVTANTLGHLLGAMNAQRAVTIRYVKETGEVSRRRIEIHAVRTTLAGNTVIECYDHRSGSRHTFRLDRVTHYTLHRSGMLATYRVPVIAADQPEILDRNTGEVAGFRAWEFLFQLAA